MAAGLICDVCGAAAPLVSSETLQPRHSPEGWKVVLVCDEKDQWGIKPPWVDLCSPMCLTMHAGEMASRWRQELEAAQAPPEPEIPDEVLASVDRLLDNEPEAHIDVDVPLGGQPEDDDDVPF